MPSDFRDLKTSLDQSARPENQPQSAKPERRENVRGPANEETKGFRRLSERERFTTFVVLSFYILQCSPSLTMRWKLVSSWVCRDANPDDSLIFEFARSELVALQQRLRLSFHSRQFEQQTQPLTNQLRVPSNKDAKIVREFDHQKLQVRGRLGQRRPLQHELGTADNRTRTV